MWHESFYAVSAGVVKKIAKGFGITILCLGLIAVGGVLWPPAQAPLPPSQRHYVIIKVHAIDVASGTVGPLRVGHDCRRKNNGDWSRSGEAFGA